MSKELRERLTRQGGVGWIDGEKWAPDMLRALDELYLFREAGKDAQRVLKEMGKRVPLLDEVIQ